MKEGEQVKALRPRMEALPYPALALSKTGKILVRNRLAQKLLPPLPRLRAYLARVLPESEGKVLFTGELEERTYFIGFTRTKEITILSFLESFLPLHKLFSQALLERAQTLFPELDRATAALLKWETASGAKPLFSDRLLARARRLREEERAYLRLIHLGERRWTEPCVCSLSGFFRVLVPAASKARVKLTVSCPAEANVWISPAALTYGILNLLHFVTLFEGEDEMEATVEQKGSDWILHLRFSDREGLFSLYGALTREEGSGRFPQAATFAPLFCAMAICQAGGPALELFCREGEGLLSLTLPGASHLPAAFLGAKKTKDPVSMEEWVREIFWGRF